MSPLQLVRRSAASLPPELPGKEGLYKKIKRLGVE
jgi:hypothetical protein